jgi:hypothetical protein
MIESPAESSALWNLPETRATVGGDRIFGDLPETWTCKSYRAERYHTYKKNRYQLFHFKHLRF